MMKGLVETLDIRELRKGQIIQLTTESGAEYLLEVGEEPENGTVLVTGGSLNLVNVAAKITNSATECAPILRVGQPFCINRYRCRQIQPNPIIALEVA